MLVMLIFKFFADLYFHNADSLPISGLKSVLKTYTQSQSLHELQQLKAEERISIRNILSKLSPSDIPASDDVHFLKGKLLSRRGNQLCG